ncbi:MAG: ABC transporter permease subunit, partial [Alcaligenaceae bacterium]|nr:ABC transporter permease subunit [Alcaligenaceae bacterium]
LMATLTADDFNKYTITANNLVSNVFQGYFLLTVLTFILLLFYDLFSKDYDHRTYQILFSEPIERKTIFQSKVVFALIYSLALILIVCLMTFIYLLTVRRMGYNIIPDRIGYIFHPVLVNINPLTVFGMSPKLVILPMIINNLLALLTGSSIIVFWILLILTVSFKLRSSSNTLTASVFLIIATFFISLIPVSIIFEYVFPISNFRFYDSLRGLSNINFIYIWLLSALWSYLTYRFYIKDVETIDILGGDYND